MCNRSVKGVGEQVMANLVGCVRVAQIHAQNIFEKSKGIIHLHAGLIRVIELLELRSWRFGDCLVKRCFVASVLERLQ